MRRGGGDKSVYVVKEEGGRREKGTFQGDGIHRRNIVIIASLAQRYVTKGGGDGPSSLSAFHSLGVSYDTLENVVEKGIQQVIHILGPLKRYRKPLKELPRTFVDQFDLRFSILCVTESRR